MIDSPWVRCKACDKAINPHQTKIEIDGEVLFVWENLCSECRSKVPHWNPVTEQWNNDDSSVRYAHSNFGDPMGELLRTFHNGGSSGGSFNSESRD